MSGGLGTGNRITAIFICIMAVAATACYFLIQPAAFSENENRYLQSLPEPGVEALMDGSFVGALEDYATDHFPLRDRLVGLKTATQKMTGVGDVAGIYLLSDEGGSYLIEGYRPPDNTDRIAGILRGFEDILREKGVTAGLYLTLVPTAVTVEQDRLNPHSPDGIAGIKGVNGISQTEAADRIYEQSGLCIADPLSILKEHREEGLYYRTDHHWNSRGAYYGIIPFLKAAGIEPESLADFGVPVTVGGFHGTLWSKSGDYSAQGEDILLYTHPKDELTVSYDDTGEVTDSLFNMDFADKKDKYSIFLNGLHPLVRVSNKNSITDRGLLLIKDSYANSALPFLAHYFRKIHILDTRYYRRAASDYARDTEGITDILILYNMNTMDSDQGIRGIY